MSQITTGIRSILSHPRIYDLFQFLLGSRQGQITYTQDYIRPAANAKILDIGCGTADILNCFPPSVDYFGFDLNNNYINFAKNKFGSRGTFICGDINDRLTDLPKFDLVLATGILHHLNDSEAEKLFTLASAHLNKSGRLLTLDCCFVDNQSKLAKYIISKDRGQNIRAPEGYKKFALDTFSEIKIDIRHNMSRIPYTHFIMECSNPF